MKVDKSKWKHCKLVDVCKTYQPKTIAVKSLCPFGDYFVYGANGIIGKHVEYNHDSQEVIVGCRGTCGVVHITQPKSWINGNAMVIHPNDPTMFNIDFLYYLVRSVDYSKVITGVAKPQITRANLSKITIDIPSLEDQCIIASELDALQEVIDGYRDQIADLDTLAQSIFLDTFGHVSINDKEWSITQLGELGSFKNGLNFDKEERGVKIKVIGVGDFKDLKRLDDFQSISLIELSNILDEYLLRDGDIIFVRSNGNKNLVGRCLEVFPGSEAISYSGFCIRFRKNSDINNSYLLGVLTDKEYKTAHILKSNGIGIQNINQKILTNLPIPVPPLQVEEIEKQKELLRQQLADAEMLMAERMQYYFS